MARRNQALKTVTIEREQVPESRDGPLRTKYFQQGKRDTNNDGTHKTFAKFSRSFRKFFEVFVGSETCLDLFEPSWMWSDTFGCARKRSHVFGNFRKHIALVPNAGEANDEKCGPTALIISEMCALRLENNNRLRR